MTIANDPLTLTQFCYHFAIIGKELKQVKRWLDSQGYHREGKITVAVKDAVITKFCPPAYDYPRHRCFITLGKFCRINELSQPDVQAFLNDRGFLTAYGLDKDSYQAIWPERHRFKVAVEANGTDSLAAQSQESALAIA